MSDGHAMDEHRTDERRIGEPRDTRAVVVRLHRQLLEAHRHSMECLDRAHRSYVAVCEKAQRVILDEVARRSDRPPAARDARPGPAQEHVTGWEMSVAADSWVVDHAPAHTVPVLPLMYELDMACRAASALFPGRKVVAVTSLESRRWAAFDGGELRGRTVVRPRPDDQADVDLQVETRDEQGSRTFGTCAVARLGFARDRASAPRPAVPDLVRPRDSACPYASGALFHGPSFQLMSRLVTGDNGARCRVLAESRGVPRSVLHPGLLDAALHCVPFFEIESWYPDLARDRVAFPYRLRSFVLHRDFPDSGFVRVEVRQNRVDHGALPVLDFWLEDDAGLLATFELTIVLLPRGPLARQDHASWRRFLQGTGAVAGLSLTRPGPSGRVLHLRDLKSLEWLPGSLARVYGLAPDSERLAERLAIADHLGQELSLHPSRIVVDAGLCRNVPLNALHVAAVSHPDLVVTKVDGPHPLNHGEIHDHFVGMGIERSLLTDVMRVFIQKFVRRVVLEDPAGFQQLSGRPVLYLANHQTGIESLPFCLLAVFLGRTPCRAVTTRTLREGGVLGALYTLAEQALGPIIPFRLMVFEPLERETLHDLLDEYREAASSERASLYVAVEGQRAYQADHKVSKLSSVFVDLAISARLPVVPVKLAGGLPRETLPRRLDFPFQLGGQDYYLGKALEPSELAALPYGERPRLVARKINELGPELHREVPNPPDLRFQERVAARVRAGSPEVAALIIESLSGLEDPSEQTLGLLRSLESGTGQLTGSAHPLVQALWSLTSFAPGGV